MAVDLLEKKTARTYRHIIPQLKSIDGRDDICPVKKNIMKLYMLQFHLHGLINNLSDDVVRSQCSEFFSEFIEPLQIPCGPDIKPLVCGNCEGCEAKCCEICETCNPNATPPTKP